MKLIIAGSRSIQLEPEFIDSILHHFDIHEEVHEVVCGMAKGVDKSGKEWAEDSGIVVKKMKPDYNKHGQHEAPKIRNEDMGDYADELLLIWDGRSGGSHHMRHYMLNLGKPVHEIIIK